MPNTFPKHYAASSGIHAFSILAGLEVSLCTKIIMREKDGRKK